MATCEGSYGREESSERDMVISESDCIQFYYYNLIYSTYLQYVEIRANDKTIFIKYISKFFWYSFLENYEKYTFESFSRLIMYEVMRIGSLIFINHVNIADLMLTPRWLIPQPISLHVCITNSCVTSCHGHLLTLAHNHTTQEHAIALGASLVPIAVGVLCLLGEIHTHTQEVSIGWIVYIESTLAIAPDQLRIGISSSMKEFKFFRTLSTIKEGEMLQFLLIFFIEKFVLNAL